MFSAPDKPNCSIIVKNIAPSTTPSTKKLITFFEFCGNIVSLSIFEDKETGTDSLSAYITFESEANAKTALLLNTTPINDRPVSVELAPPNFKIPANATTEGFSTTANQPEALPVPEEKTIFSEWLDNIAAQAKAIDDEHNLTQTVTVGLNTVSSSVNQTFTSIDSQLQISETVKSFGTGISTAVDGVDKEYEISNKAQEVGVSVTTFMNSATSTAATGLESAKIAIDEFVESPTVQASVASVKQASTSLMNSIENLFSPK
jgi:RNA recognition motif-containing protein